MWPAYVDVLYEPVRAPGCCDAIQCMLVLIGLNQNWRNITLYRDCTDSRENVLHVCQLGDAVLQLSAMEREKVRLFLSQPEGWGSCVKSQQLW